MIKKALLFVNGEPPLYYPIDLYKYDFIACTDGAYSNYLSNSSIVPDFIIGDLDSLNKQNISTQINIIYTPDQNKTDFEKALLCLADKGVKIFDIYGASGKASDHFLGNLYVALKYYKKWKLTFYDNYCRFFFVQTNTTIKWVKDKTISLIPLTAVNDLTITGFEYPLNHARLEPGGLMSLRNKAIEDHIHITFFDGNLLIFIAL